MFLFNAYSDTYQFIAYLFSWGLYGVLCVQACAPLQQLFLREH